MSCISNFDDLRQDTLLNKMNKLTVVQFCSYCGAKDKQLFTCDSCQTSVCKLDVHSITTNTWGTAVILLNQNATTEVFQKQLLCNFCYWNLTVT